MCTRYDRSRLREPVEPRDDLVRLRRVRDRIDREPPQPLDFLALARGQDIAAGQLSREFRDAYGESVYDYVLRRRQERAGHVTGQESRSAMADRPPSVSP